MNQNPTVKIIHQLPGRLRIRLSNLPENPDNMVKKVREHPGIFEIKLTVITKSVLLSYDPSEISQEELILRIAVYISLENQHHPVNIYTDVDVKDMSQFAFFSGGLIIAALASRLFVNRVKLHSAFDWMAGIGTAYSIFNHGYSELKKRGNFDPEVLSIIYLLTAFMQGKFLPATFFTWITTFGRHLMDMPSKNVEIRPNVAADSDPKDPHYEVVITPISSLPGKKNLLKLLPTVIMHATMGETSKALQGTLLDEIKRVSQNHGEVLEGFQKFQSGIPIRIQS